MDYAAYREPVAFGLCMKHAKRVAVRERGGVSVWPCVFKGDMECEHGHWLALSLLLEFDFECDASDNVEAGSGCGASPC